MLSELSQRYLAPRAQAACDHGRSGLRVGPGPSLAAAWQSDMTARTVKRVMWPDAEVAIDEQVVRSLLAEQAPRLADLAISPAGVGWDNVMWRLGERLAVRMPRRESAAHLAVKEQRWVNEVGKTLPLAVPMPVHAGRPGCGYPWHWSVVLWLDGEPADQAAIESPSVAAAALGGFMRCLHRRAPADAPDNAFRGVPLASRSDVFNERLEVLDGHVDGPALRRGWASALQARSYQEPPVWLHGDLHPANLIVSSGALAGVIDFGDLCAGDPATDLAALHMLLPRSVAPVFWQAYGRWEEDLERRSIGWALLFGLMLMEIGLEGPPSYAQVGRSTLDRATRESDRCG